MKNRLYQLLIDANLFNIPKGDFVKNNTNALLRIIPEVDGIKTGYTGNAGYCLSFSMKINKNEDNEKEKENWCSIRCKS